MSSVTPRTGVTPGDEGGEAPCMAHLLDDGDGDATDRDALPASVPTTWKGLVDHLADAVLVADRAGAIVYWNDAAERVFGWSATEAVGETLDLIIPERLRKRHWDGWNS